MSCWRRTTVLRIPATALGFKYLWQWNEFLEKHQDDFRSDPGCFDESMCDDYPGGLYPWGDEAYYDPNRCLGKPDPEYRELVPGPFLDYFIEDIIPLHPEDNSYHENDYAEPLSQAGKERYLPEYRKLFPDFTLEDMDAVHYCKYEWYDGTNAPYLY